METTDLIRRAEDLAARCERTSSVTATAFLTPAERMELQNAPSLRGTAVAYSGGGTECERTCAFFLPFYLTAEELDPSEYISAVHFRSFFGEPGHRDYLGAILGLGLERSCVGDLLADPEREDTFYAVILADKQEFINAELTGAGHCTVHTACIDALPARLAESRERTLQEATVPSLRADAVLAAMLHTSRTRAAEYIAAGRVEINHLPLKTAHETAYAADIFTVRGVGRFKLAAIGGKSRKDRLFISFYQY